jgi:cell division protease FtsH
VSNPAARGPLSDLYAAADNGQRRPRNGPPQGPQGPGGNGPGGDKKTPPPMPPGRGLFGILSFAIVCVLLFMMINSPGRGDKITLEQLQARIGNQTILPEDVTIRDDVIEAKQNAGADGAQTTVYVPLNARTGDEVAKQVLALTHNKAKVAPQSPWTQFIVFFLPLILFVMVIWYLISRGLRGAAGGAGMLGSFGKSRHRTLNKEMTGITFADVAGIEEAKEEVAEIIEFLKNPKKFTKLGGRIPRGVLLVGEPGCGKTLLAKAIAGEADVPFFSISGSDFVEMFVGVGASRVRDLFKQAKDSAPCIIFLDEIDAVGRRRGSGFTTGGHDEREQTLNAILVEMDGFAPADGVIVIAATNRADVLDPALIRPGRFDRQVVVPLPDLRGRLEILKVHAKKVKLSPFVDLERIARGTPNFSGADLAAIINEAAISATMLSKDAVDQEDLEEARDKVKFGRAKKSRVREQEENKLVAYHEAGHAVLQKLLPADPLHKVTIISRGPMGGATFSLPEKDRSGYSLKWLTAEMRILCGGRIAEEKAMGDASSGAAGDIMQVTHLARAMVLEWGMSPRLGFIRYAPQDTRESFLPEKDYSDQTAHLIDEEIRRLVDEAFADAKQLLEANWDKVVLVAEALLKHETLTGDDVDRLMSGQLLTKPTVAEMLVAAAAKKRASETAARGSESPDLPPGAMPSPA